MRRSFVRGACGLESRGQGIRIGGMTASLYSLLAEPTRVDGSVLHLPEFVQSSSVGNPISARGPYQLRGWMSCAFPLLVFQRPGFTRHSLLVVLHKSHVCCVCRASGQCGKLQGVTLHLNRKGRVRFPLRSKPLSGVIFFTLLWCPAEGL